jgi:hypothetical protein
LIALPHGFFRYLTVRVRACEAMSQIHCAIIAEGRPVRTWSPTTTLAVALGDASVRDLEHQLRFRFVLEHELAAEPLAVCRC